MISVKCTSSVKTAMHLRKLLILTEEIVNSKCCSKTQDIYKIRDMIKYFSIKQRLQRWLFYSITIFKGFREL